jgi:hypothetical protein
MIASICARSEPMPGRTFSTSTIVGFGGRLGLVAVDDEQPARGDGVARHRRGPHRQARMAVPQHRALARPGVDDDDGELIGSAGDDA